MKHLPTANGFDAFVGFLGGSQSCECSTRSAAAACHADRQREALVTATSRVFSGVMCVCTAGRLR
jgi:hypothetical protein